jgi:hypothetical protein
MKKRIIIALAVLALIAVPATIFAATYQYVDVNGNVRTIIANNATEALRAPDIHRNSGVLLIATSTPVICPTGYICRPNNPQTPVSCPAGYICTPNNNSSGTSTTSTTTSQSTATSTATTTATTTSSM